MRTPWRVKPEKTVPLIILLIFLIAFLSANIHKIWWNHFSSWTDLGAPPERAWEILRMDFPSTSSAGTLPVVFAFAADSITYRCCSGGVGQWEKTGYPLTKFPDNGDQGTDLCGTLLEQEWGIEMEPDASAVESGSFGRCKSPASNKYAQYHVMPDGTVREKYMDGGKLHRVQTILSAIIGALILLSLFFMTGVLSKVKLPGREFLYAHRIQLALLGLPLLFLIILWNINIYRIWYDHTPWEKSGSPPSRIVKVLRVEFPYLYKGRDVYSYLLGSPEMFVYTEYRKIYAVNWAGQWRPVAYPESSRISPSNSSKAGEISCTERIQYLWGLEEEQDERAILIEARGSCTTSLYNDDQYVVYKIMESGEVWRKYVDGYAPERLHRQINTMLWLFLVLSAPVWSTMIIYIDPVKLKPDYAAR